MRISRETYLDKLVRHRHNGMIKVVTGIRRCGKSYLLFTLFKDWLLAHGVPRDHIIEANLDSREARELHDADRLWAYVMGAVVDSAVHYVLIDEVQLAHDFESVLNGFLYKQNLDVYVTGSNARLLSRDVITEFRGRGDEISLRPLSFGEYMSGYAGSVERGLNEYMIYGGLPQILLHQEEEDKADFLRRLFEETYLRDIKERYGISNEDEFEELLSLMASNVSCLTNPNKLANTFCSRKGVRLDQKTIKTYLNYMEDAFLIERATRYDIKGNAYIDTPYKYYFTDMGLRNARLNFRQIEKSHLMENVLYNELRSRGFNVDVGVVPVRRKNADGQQRRQQLEVDFVCNQGSRRYYIQSAWRMDTPEKTEQEKASLAAIDDSFRKIIIVGEDTPPLRDDKGILTVGVYDFLLQKPLE